MYRKRGCVDAGFAMLICMLMMLLCCLPAYPSECISYSDCQEFSCPGKFRDCVRGSCVYSDCLFEDNSMKYGRGGMQDGGTGAGQSDQMFGIGPILLFSLKIMIMIVAGIVLAFMMTMLKAEGVMKLIIVSAAIIMITGMGAYMFLGKTDLFSLERFGLSDGDYNQMDSYIVDYVNSNDRRLSELTMEGSNNGMQKDEIELAKEYRISDARHESIVVVMSGQRPLQALSASLARAGAEIIEEINVLVYSQEHYSTYVWEDDRYSFVVRAQEDEAARIARAIIAIDRKAVPAKDETPSEPATLPSAGDTEVLLPRGLAPVVEITVPLPGDKMNGKQARFFLDDADSDLLINTLRVDGAQGFGGLSADCIKDGRGYGCSFMMENLLSGPNRLTVQIHDEQGNIGSAAIDFIFDELPWKSRNLMPKDGASANVDYVSFEIFDNESGIDPATIDISGLGAIGKDCLPIEKGYRCRVSGFGGSEGKNSYVIAAADIAGNYHTEEHVFFLDRVKPDVNITDWGFLVSDESGIDNQSVIVNKKKYDMTQCEADGAWLSCPYKYGVMEIYVRDISGNAYSSQYRRER